MIQTVFDWVWRDVTLMSTSSLPTYRSRPDVETDTQPPLGVDRKSPLRMEHLQQLRMMLDELAVKLDARDCLENNRRHRYAARIQVESELMKFLDSMQDLVASHFGKSDEPAVTDESVAGTIPKASAASKTTAIRIQLKLSPALVRVLQAVRQENVKASELVEEVLWQAPRIQDIAQLAGIQRPVRAPAA
jgi:hypothetical protein